MIPWEEAKETPMNCIVVFIDIQAGLTDRQLFGPMGTDEHVDVYVY